MGEEMTLHTLAPSILREGDYGRDDLAQLRAQGDWRIVDIFERQLADLFEISNPALRSEDNDYESKKQDFIKSRVIDEPELSGDWVLYRERGVLLHCVGEQSQWQLRTNRNQNLITQEEQTALAEAKIAIAGMSVGGGIAVGLAYSGVGRTFNLADFDMLETPNLNRVQARLDEIGQRKTDIVADRIWGLDPYAKLHLFPEGIDSSTVDQFLMGSQPVDVVFDEIDNFQMKLQIRYAAKRLRIPVVMMTGLGDSVVIDIERYDIDPELKIFNGLIGELESDINASSVTEADAKRYAAQIIDIKNVPTRAIQSLIEIGKTLVGRPQLASTVTTESGLASFIARKLILNAPIKSGRYKMAFTDIFELESDTADSELRQSTMKQLLK